MIKNQLKKLVGSAIQDLDVEAEAKIETPKKQWGDYSCGVSFDIAPQAKKNPYALAQEIAANIPSSDLVERIEVSRPGFINFWLKMIVLGRNLLV